MSFLQPLLLVGLPLVALPILIHLIHRRRHRTVEWGAMMFLMAARKINRGWQRLRHFLILLFRTLAVAGLILAISRPLSGGWLGFAIGARPDTAIVLLDRSASMQEQDLQRAQSKLTIGTEKLVNTLQTVRASRWALIESNEQQPIELQAPEDLLTLPAARETATQADIPGMLQAGPRVHRRESNRPCGDLDLLRFPRQRLAKHEWSLESSSRSSHGVAARGERSPSFVCREFIVELGRARVAGATACPSG